MSAVGPGVDARDAESFQGPFAERILGAVLRLGGPAESEFGQPRRLGQSPVLFGLLRWVEVLSSGLD